MTEESTARRRELGSELRILRKRHNMSGHQLGRRLEWPPSSISRLETGVRPLPVTDVATFLGTIGATAEERARLLKLAELKDDSYWVRPYFGQLADPMKSLILQESLAESIVSYEPLVIPGLLQTEPYVRTVFENFGRHTRDRVDFLVNARLDRQTLLSRWKPPHCTFFIHERALRTVVGNAQVMHEQLLNLVLSSNMSRCCIRIIPDSVPSLRTFASPFFVMEFGDHPAVVYTDTYAAGIFIDDRTGVEEFYLIAASLEQHALNEGNSRQWLVQMASEYERMEE
jgi:transcriptional regulator with XRE-family HTH domain